MKSCPRARLASAAMFFRTSGARPDVIPTPCLDGFRRRESHLRCKIPKISRLHPDILTSPVPRLPGKHTNSSPPTSRWRFPRKTGQDDIRYPRRSRGPACTIVTPMLKTHIMIGARLTLPSGTKRRSPGRIPAARRQTLKAMLLPANYQKAGPSLAPSSVDGGAAPKTDPTSAPEVESPLSHASHWLKLSQLSLVASNFSHSNPFPNKLAKTVST